MSATIHCHSLTHSFSVGTKSTSPNTVVSQETELYFCSPSYGSYNLSITHVCTAPNPLRALTRPPPQTHSPETPEFKELVRRHLQALEVEAKAKHAHWQELHAFREHSFEIAKQGAIQVHQ
jgi:hypothetical protein